MLNAVLHPNLSSLNYYFLDISTTIHFKKLLIPLYTHHHQLLLLTQGSCFPCLLFCQERCLDLITQQRKIKEKIRLIGEMGQMSIHFLGTNSSLPSQIPGHAKVKAGALPWAPLVDGVDSLEVWERCPRALPSDTWSSTWRRCLQLAHTQQTISRAIAEPWLWRGAAETCPGTCQVPGMPSLSCPTSLPQSSSPLWVTLFAPASHSPPTHPRGVLGTCCPS